MKDLGISTEEIVEPCLSSLEQPELLFTTDDEEVGTVVMGVAYGGGRIMEVGRLWWWEDYGSGKIMGVGGLWWWEHYGEDIAVL